ncbi:VOC family protein [Gramella sp. MAR_2010_147]|uniref:VOC family protein n=1 Tax=Gramella sp. MAR_2010_147 TaxID=1250205 RepID=UPI00087C412C|nr:VOC family protein [Gramella sp. MAR_2010_147]SDR92655.1 PhnB protein [Gramella sp. MAR_2010_147]
MSLALNTYLTFNGNCDEAFSFYRSVFGGEFKMKSSFGEMPQDSDMPEVKEEEKDLIMHISLFIGENNVLMGSDTGGEWGKHFKEGNNFSISISTDTKQEADHIFKELSAGGKKTMSMDQTFWGSYFGMLTDKFNIQWMVSFDMKK